MKVTQAFVAPLCVTGYVSVLLFQLLNCFFLCACMFATRYAILGLLQFHSLRFAF